MLKINKFDDKTNNFDDNSPYNLGYFYLNIIILNLMKVKDLKLE